MKNVEKCCLCKGDLAEQGDHWQGGNNDEPIMVGQCCDVCNDTKVIPVRLAALSARRTDVK